MEVEFQYPIMFLGFLLIPLLVVLHFYFFEHTKKRAMKFANFTAMKRVTGSKIITKNTSQLVLRILIFTLLILVSAHPVLWYNGNQSLTDYVIAIDNSASMVNQDVKPDRLTVAKNSAIGFLDRLQSETQVGLIAFSGITKIKTPLTTDLKQVKQDISKIDIELSGGTDIGSAIISAVNVLMPSDKSKAIILVSDGSDTSGTYIEEGFDNSIQYALDNHVVVHSIGIGTGLDSVGYIDDPNLKAIYDKDALKTIAERTGGNFYDVATTAEISTAFKDISSDKQQSVISYDPTPMMFLAAAILLLFEWGLLNTRFRALP